MLDNLSAHKTKAVGDSWRQPESSFHFAPSYSSWLNQVELWFAILLIIARGVFTSLAGLARKLRKYVRAYAKWAKKFFVGLYRPLASNPYLRKHRDSLK